MSMLDTAHRNRRLHARTSRASVRLSALPTSRRLDRRRPPVPTPFTFTRILGARRMLRLHFATRTQLAHVSLALAALFPGALACRDLPAAWLPPPPLTRPLLQCWRLAVS